MGKTKQNILIVDDHALFADGLSLILQTLGEEISVSVSSDAAHVLKDSKSVANYDLVLIDLHMPGMDGFSFLSAVQVQKIPVSVGVISGTESRVEIERAAALGACGFIPKDSPSSEMLNAVRRLLNGHHYLPEHWSDRVNWLANQPEAVKSVDHMITDRQLQVLQLMKDGLQNKQIAMVLGVSVSTVKGHVENVFKALQVNNRTACVKVAGQRGLL